MKLAPRVLVCLVLTGWLIGCGSRSDSDQSTEAAGNADWLGAAQFPAQFAWGRPRSNRSSPTWR